MVGEEATWSFTTLSKYLHHIALLIIRTKFLNLRHYDLNFSPYVQTQLYKLASSGLCSGVDGQMMTSLMCRPPMPGEESFDRFTNEEFAIFDSLRRKAVSLVKGLNEIDGKRLFIFSLRILFTFFNAAICR